jgi:tellurite resistance protein TerA
MIEARPEGFGTIRIGAAWDNVVAQQSGLINKLLKKVTRQGIDIDLGCLYELHDGSRGCVQAFGEMFGSYDEVPFMRLSGDEKTGDASGDDEHIDVNGSHWEKVKRILVYVYIYHGEHDWAAIKPQIHVSIKDGNPMIVSPDVHNNELDVCAIAMIENAGGHIKLTNHTEYFPGHAEMDRAFGFGLQWDDGRK